LLKAKDKVKCTFYLIGVLPEYQNKAVTAILLKSVTKHLKKRHTNCYRTPELANNLAIQNLWKHFDPVVHKRRCTFIKSL
jgi:GNAT superfamily N-acetyltransferase